MRAGSCTVQQTLTPEAASVVKQAVALARRRGHAQVTPLHVANTMLAAPTGLLRTACLQSHSHPLQCKALELCFNVALNRLPTSTSSPILGAGHGSPFPSIANALVAAFKRAQAHQRRGSIENQQQPILAVKIELEQLIISILDDPSVSRVMREAGFSSTQVKSNVEQAVSLEICSKTTSSKPKEASNALSLSPTQIQTKATKISPVRSDDVMYVIDNLVNKRRKNFVIVGECLATIEGVIRAVVEKVDKRDVPEALRDVKFVTLSFSSFGQLSRIEVEQRLEELKALARSSMNRGVILNLGDLNWVVEYRARSTSGDHQLGMVYSYCAVEHMVMELGKLACGSIGESTGRLWLIALATFQTYMRCKSGRPSLESVWCLNALTIPAGSLRLSLITDSDQESDPSTKKKLENGSRWLQLEGGDKQLQQLTCCPDCSANFDNEARSLQRSSGGQAGKSTLPAWLQQCKNQNKELSSNNDKDTTVSIKELCKKWNSICNSVHKQPYSSSERTLLFSSFSPSSSLSGFSCEMQRPNLHQINRDWSVTDQPRQQHQLFMSETISNAVGEPNLRLFVPHYDFDPKPISSNPNSTRNSPSSSDLMEMEFIRKFKELTAENITIICNALEKKVPWQKNIIPEIARTILKCRSGAATRRENEFTKEETWLFFQGTDADAKEKIARELARLVFGSQSCFLSICLSTFSYTRADSTEDIRNKRSRDELSWSYIERFSEAASRDPHRVFFVEDIEQADYFSKMGFKRAIDRGKIKNEAGEEVSLGDAIIILSCESFSSRSRACSPPVKQKPESSDQDEKNASSEQTSPCVSLDLNLSIDDESLDDQLIDDIGLLEAVDGRINFRTHHQDQ